MFQDWDWAGAKRAVERAVELTPESSVSRQWHALLLAIAGDAVGARREISRARELDPVALIAANLSALIHSLAREHEQELDLCRAAAELEPNVFVAHWTLGLAYVHNGRFDDAIDSQRRAVELAQQAPFMKAVLAWTLATADLLNPNDQKGVLQELSRVRAVGAAFDPARAYMPTIDGGPVDGAAAVAFLRQVQNETACKTILVPDHDVKPARDGKDPRTRSDKASGGVLFSSAECPVNFERVDDRTCFAVPANYKIGSDPEPFRVRFESATSAGESFSQFARPVAETVTERQDLEQRRNAWLEEHVIPDVLPIVEASNNSLSGTAVHKERGGNRKDALDALKLLAATQRVDTVPGRKTGDVAYQRLP